MRYPKEALVFRVIDSNGSPVPVGSIVEFYDWQGDNAIEACHVGGKYKWGPWTKQCNWSFHYLSLEPLTDSAAVILAVLS